MITKLKIKSIPPATTNFSINEAELKKLLALCKKAESLGLSFRKVKGEYKFFAIAERLSVEIKKYDITDWNGYNCGHTMITTWTKQEAEVLRGIIDKSIADSNPKRSTKIEVSPHSSASTEDLQWFIKTHTKKVKNIVQIFPKK